jgi:delta-aminolevulinic acid dehydratase/porphobilinogen synthase
MIRLAPLLLALLPACSSGPIIDMPDGTRVVMAPSLFEKTTDEAALVEMPNGLRVAYSKKGKDQTILVREGIRAWATVAGITAAADGLNAGEAIREKGMTLRAVSGDSVTKAKVAGDVAIKTFVPHVP